MEAGENRRPVDGLEGLVVAIEVSRVDLVTKASMIRGFWSEISSRMVVVEMSLGMAAIAIQVPLILLFSPIRFRCISTQWTSTRVTFVSVVHSLILSIDETNYPLDKSESCNASCIRLSLVKLLQSSGYDAAICATKWQGVGKIPGGEHEFIDVINHFNDGRSEQYIIDIEFCSHFEIARAVQSYDAVLRALPPVFVGSMSKLKQFLQAMEEAARASRKQNSMPLPPWQSLAYLQAKWKSTSLREVRPHEQSIQQFLFFSEHQHCSELLRRLKSRVESEIRGAIVKPRKNDGKQRLKPERWRNSSFRTR